MASGGPRPGAGRPRKAPALKQLAGTDRADRQLAISEDVPIGPMIVPMHLSDLEQLYFTNVAQMLEQQKRASPHFAEHVALLAQRLAQIQRWKSVLEVEGDTHTSTTVRVVDGKALTTSMVRARPEVKMLSDAMRHAQSLLGELMLNPAAALRIASGHKPQAGDFDDF